MRIADEPKLDAISQGIGVRHRSAARVMSRLDVQILLGVGQSSALALMKSTKRAFRIAGQYFVLEEDLYEHLRRLAEEASE